MDWNWFFSSLAQSGAALVGVIGAFIISKLLNEGEKMESLNQRMNDLFEEYALIKGRLANRQFDTYNKRVMLESYDLGVAIKGGIFDGLSTTDAEKRLYKIVPKLYYSNYNLIRLLNMIRKQNSDDLNGSDISTEEDIPPISPTLSGGPAVEYASIEELRLQSKDLIARFMSTRSRIFAQQDNLITIRMIIAVLMAGFIFCVLYPLHFLPLSINENPSITFSLKNALTCLFSIQGGLLVVMSFIIIGVFVYFYCYSLSIGSEYYSKVGFMSYGHVHITGYSPYFRSLED